MQHPRFQQRVAEDLAPVQRVFKFIAVPNQRGCVTPKQFLRGDAGFQIRRYGLRELSCAIALQSLKRSSSANNLLAAGEQDLGLGFGEHTSLEFKDTKPVLTQAREHAEHFVCHGTPFSEASHNKVRMSGQLDGQVLKAREKIRYVCVIRDREGKLRSLEPVGQGRFTPRTCIHFSQDIRNVSGAKEGLDRAVIASRDPNSPDLRLYLTTAKSSVWHNSMTWSASTEFRCRVASDRYSLMDI